MSNAELQQRQQEIAKLVNEKSEQQAELKDRIDKADQKYAEAQKNIKEAIVEFSKFRASSKEAITKEKERSTEAIKQEAQLSAMLGHERQDNVALHARLSEMEAELVILILLFYFYFLEVISSQFCN
jgi:septal ring factor EnvC (AmiA/AmiB activator)